MRLVRVDPDEIDGGIDEDSIDPIPSAHDGYLIFYDGEHFLDETVLDHERASWFHIIPPNKGCLIIHPPIREGLDESSPYEYPNFPLP
jgi:hypothetical protein